MYDVMAMETGMLKSVMAYVKEHCAEELAMLNAEVPEIKEIPTIRFHEPSRSWRRSSATKSKNRYDLNPDEEVLLCQWAKEEHDSDFVFVTHFPSAKRPVLREGRPGGSEAGAVVRPAVPRSGDYHRRSAYPRLSGADGQAGGPQDERRAV